MFKKNVHNQNVQLKKESYKYTKAINTTSAIHIAFGFFQEKKTYTQLYTNKNNNPNPKKCQGKKIECVPRPCIVYLNNISNKVGRRAAPEFCGVFVKKLFFTFSLLE